MTFEVSDKMSAKQGETNQTKWFDCIVGMLLNIVVATGMSQTSLSKMYLHLAMVKEEGHIGHVICII